MRRFAPVFLVLMLFQILAAPCAQMASAQAFLSDPFPYKFTEERYTAHPIGALPTEHSSKIGMIEDAAGRIHAFFIDEQGNLAHKRFEGGEWSEAHLISKDDSGAGSSKWIWHFAPILTPTGEAAVIALLHAMDGDEYVLTPCRDGQPAETESLLALPGSEFSNDFYDAYYDANGALHILHYRGSHDDPKREGIYIDQLQLTRETNSGDAESSAFLTDGALPGLGKDVELMDFAYDARGGLLYCHALIKEDGDAGQELDTYRHEYGVSRDDGQSWEGPYATVGGLIGANRVRGIQSGFLPDGRNATMFFHNGADIELPCLTLIIGDADGNVEITGYFDQDYIEEKRREGKDARYTSHGFFMPLFYQMLANASGELHFLGQYTASIAHAVVQEDGKLRIAETNVPFMMEYMLPLRDGRVAFYGVDLMLAEGGQYSLYIQK